MLHKYILPQAELFKPSTGKIGIMEHLIGTFVMPVAGGSIASTGDLCRFMIVFHKKKILYNIMFIMFYLLSIIHFTTSFDLKVLRRASITKSHVGSSERKVVVFVFIYFFLIMASFRFCG